MQVHTGKLFAAFNSDLKNIGTTSREAMSCACLDDEPRHSWDNINAVGNVRRMSFTFPNIGKCIEAPTEVGALYKKMDLESFPCLS